jgi:hypothetical protein
MSMGKNPKPSLPERFPAFWATRELRVPRGHTGMDDAAIVAALAKTDIRFFLLQNDFKPGRCCSKSAQLQADDAPSKNAKVVPHDRSQFTLASAC